MAAHLVQGLEADDVDGDDAAEVAGRDGGGEAGAQRRLQADAIGQPGQAIADLGGLGVLLGLGLRHHRLVQLVAAAEGIGEDTGPGGDEQRHQRRTQRRVGGFEHGDGSVKNSEAVVE
ncbi:hypothetical protein [Pinisolibacter aquiterrae]|uniref:hypothetical protein n=1 Tax=Pinisolibacter aquiterrae TaxID=2815579 RepID=UPI001E5A0DFF|nr:hypothetical protein [Pinisolibacter aquiterrae]MCC8236414.1 hypothetical protein [Pinisolibacter aquiterrae]